MPREQAGTKDSWCRGLEEHQRSASGNDCRLQASGCNCPKKDLQPNIKSDNLTDDRLTFVTFFTYNCGISTLLDMNTLM